MLLVPAQAQELHEYWSTDAELNLFWHMQAEELETHWRFKHTWQHTYLRASSKISQGHAAKRRQVQGFYSDLLYQPWHCASVPLHKSWLKRDTIDRRADLSVEEFKLQYEAPNKPVILQHAVSWSHSSLSCTSAAMWSTQA